MEHEIIGDLRFDVRRGQRAGTRVINNAGMPSPTSDPVGSAATTVGTGSWF
jgi:hypothetical protein